MGNPEGLEGTFSRGNISAFRIPRPIPDADLFDPVPEYIQITAPISHGSSGGPVLDERGEVIGVAAGIFTEGQNLNFAVPVSKLAALLRDTSYDDVIAAALRAPDNPFLVPLPVPEWQLVTSGGGNNYYISRSRIKLTPEHTLIAWIKIVPDDSPEGRTARQRKIDSLKTQNVSRRYAFGYSMHQHQFDCGHQKTQLLTSVDYDDQEGELLYDWGDLPAGPNWNPVLPNSVGEAELNFVCKGRQ